MHCPKTWACLGPFMVAQEQVAGRKQFSRSNPKTTESPFKSKIELVTCKTLWTPHKLTITSPSPKTKPRMN
jgi:hypothetical protein